MKWLSFYIGGQQWSAWLVSPKSKYLQVPVEDGCVRVGNCNYEKCRIYLSRALEPQALEDALLHELLHALLHVTGAESAYDGDPAKDENLVQKLTPSLHRLLLDLGFQFPKAP